MNSRFSVIDDDILFASADIIVNMANRYGYMGNCRISIRSDSSSGKRMNFVTDGRIGRASLLAARPDSKVPSWFYGRRPGSMFVTKSCGLDCRAVMHAVASRHLSSGVDLKSLESSLESICLYCCNSPDYRRIAFSVPSDMKDADKISALIREVCRKYRPLDVLVYTGKCSREALLTRRKQIRQKRESV